MHFKLSSKLPKKLYLACSGGPDSMFALHFLSQSNRHITLLYVNHGTKFGNECEKFLTEMSHSNPAASNLIIHKITTDKSPDESQEEYWRNCRYSFFSNFDPVVTCHHLDDQIETMLMGFIHGRVRKIHSARDNLLRPFLNLSKEQILEYCNYHGLKYMVDPSNTDVSFDRNKIRHKILPLIQEINPGYRKSIVRNT